MEGVDGIDLGRLVDEAVASFRRVQSPEDYEAIWEALGQAADAGSAALELALGMLGSGDPAMRAVGCDLIGVMSNGSDDPPRRAARALVDLADHETDGDVLWSIAGALQHATDPIAVPVLVTMASHQDSDVRFNVALALPAAMRGRVDAGGIDALIALTRDADPEVRNWATFGLGRQVDVDGAEIRQALWARVGDDDADVREEAICSLARRRDRRAVRLVGELLRSGDVHVWVFDAAARLGDESLLADLEEYDGPSAVRAIRACDPLERLRQDEAGWELLSRLQTALDEQRPGVVAVLYCDIWDDNGLILQVDVEGDSVWSVEALLESVSGEPDEAVAQVIGQLPGANDTAGATPRPRNARTA